MFSLRFSLCGLALLALSGTANAELVTDPIGIIKVQVPAETDALLGAPLHRAPVYSGTITSAKGSTITFNAATTGWTSNQWQYSGDTQPQVYYVLLTSGSLEGYYFTIDGNTDSTLTLDTGGALLGDYQLEGAGAQIIPYWTLGTLFGPQGQLVGSAGITGAGKINEVRVYTPNAGTAAPIYTFYYYTGDAMGGAGWRCRGAAWSDKFDDFILPPDAGFIFRNRKNSAVELSIVGNVQLAQSAVSVPALFGSSSQDSFATNSSAVPTTLAQSRLYESGVIKGSATIDGLGGDAVMVYAAGKTGMNTPPTSTYFYYEGADFGGKGWRKLGGNNTVIENDSQVFQPGYACCIHRNTAETGSARYWVFLPPYLQQPL